MGTEIMDEINSDDEEEERLIEKINALFVDDDEEERNQFVQYLYRVFESMKKTADSIYKVMEVMAKRIGMVYTYFSTKTQGEMVEDLMMTFENGDDKIYEIYQQTTSWIVDG